MTTFKLQKIDESLLQDHSCLTPQDYCFFFGDYAGRQGFGFSPMNDLMHNFKKPVERKNRQEWRYKEKAIEDIANLLISEPKWEKLKACLWVPMPSSKLKSNEDYDDRLMQVLLKIKENEHGLDVREILTIKSGRDAAHDPGSKRPSVTEHLNNFVFDVAQKNPIPSSIVIFDDVITTGASFKAAQSILRKNYPGIPIGGIFIGRSIKQILS